MVIVSELNPLANHRSTTLEALAQLPMVLLDLPLSREYFMSLFREAGVSPLIAARSASPDRKSTRLNSSHLVISYAVFCLKKKNKQSLSPADLGWQSVGDFIRAQRRLANLSLRQHAHLAHVSNPYLSQVERGLYRTSAAAL